MSKVEGVEDVKKWLEGIDLETQAKMKRAIQAGGMAIQKRARASVAVDQGELRQSIISTDIIRPDDFVAVIGPTAKHGPYIEYGTRPHYPPTAPLKRWAERHGFKNPVFASELIAKKIAHRGTKPRPYLIPAYNVVSPKVFKKINSIVRAIK